MTVAVTSSGSFERDVAVARNLEGVVVLSANPEEVFVMSSLENGDLWFGQHSSIAAFFEKNRADGKPWFSFEGVAYVEDPELITDFKPHALDEAKELYADIVGRKEPVAA